MQKLLTTLFIISLSLPVVSSLSIMTYNVENLFDTLDDEGKDDKAYLPLAQKQSKEHIESCNKVKVQKWRNECLYFDWTEDAKNKKLKNIKEVILSAKSDGPDVIAFQEIENINVLSDLFNLLAPYGYVDFSLIEGNDYRGIDTAYISKYPLENKSLHKIIFSPEFATKDTRPIFEAQIRIDNITYRLYNIHFPAPYHPVGMRKDAFNSLNSLTEAHNDPFIALGDFNVTRVEANIERTFYNIEDKWLISNHEGCNDCLGSHYYWRDKSWSYLDKIMISKKRGLSFKTDSIKTVVNDINTINRIPEGFDTKSGHGVSDHLPVYAEIVL